MVTTIVLILLSLLMAYCVIEIWCAMFRENCNPHPQFDSQETIRFRDLKIEKTRAICFKSI